MINLSHPHSPAMSAPDNDRPTPNPPDFGTLFKIAQRTFERGQYQESIERLQAAGKMVLPASKQGGDVQLWLVNAYQARGDVKTAIALCEKLLKHPFVNKKARDLLYILKAPVLERPKEWLTEIPDLQRLDESKLSDRYVTAKPKTKPKPKATDEPEIDPAEIETKDNQFVLIALTVLVVVFGYFAFLA